MKVKSYCINLLERNDRYIHAQSEFKKFKETQDSNFFDIIEYLRVNRHEKGGRYGCFESHIRCIRKAYDENADFVFIFEDDFIFRRKTEIPNLVRVLEKYNPDLVLSHKRPLVRTKYIEDKFYEVIGFGGTFYIVNRITMKLILDEYMNHIDFCHYDLFINYLRISGKIKMYGYYPIVKCVALGSDNDDWDRESLMMTFFQYLTNVSMIPEEISYYTSYTIPYNFTLLYDSIDSFIIDKYNNDKNVNK